MKNKRKAKIITPEGVNDSGEPKGLNNEKLASTWHLNRSTPDIEMKLKDGTVIASIEFKFYNPKNPGGTILGGPEIFKRTITGPEQEVYKIAARL